MDTRANLTASEIARASVPFQQFRIESTHNKSHNSKRWRWCAGRPGSGTRRGALYHIRCPFGLHICQHGVHGTGRHQHDRLHTAGCQLHRHRIRQWSDVPDCAAESAFSSGPVPNRLVFGADTMRVLFHLCAGYCGQSAANLRSCGKKGEGRDVFNSAFMRLMYVRIYLFGFSELTTIAGTSWLLFRLPRTHHGNSSWASSKYAETSSAQNLEDYRQRSYSNSLLVFQTATLVVIADQYADFYLRRARDAHIRSSSDYTPNAASRS